MFNDIIFIAETVLPVFSIIALGYILKRNGFINENFIILSSKIVFTIALPCMIFTEISQINIKEQFNTEVIIYLIFATLVSFVISWIAVKPLRVEPKDEAAFIQGSFRGNFAIVGLALISNMYGSSEVAEATIMLVFVLPTYNILSIIALTLPIRNSKTVSLGRMVSDIILNPLIVAVIVALVFSFFQITPPPVALKTVNLIARIAIPLALLGIGGSLSKQGVLQSSHLSTIATILKIVVFPILLTLGAYFYGFRDSDLILLFILFSSPTAVVSFIMAEAMGANSQLASSIILLTTVFSAVTISTGLLILRITGLLY